MTRTSAVAKALARHRAAQAAYDAVAAADDADTDSLFEAECDAYDDLEKTPCASDEEFLEKLKYMSAREVHLFGNPFEASPEFVSVARAAALHFRESGIDAGAAPEPGLQNSKCP